MNAANETTGKSMASRWKHHFMYGLIAAGGRVLAYLFLYPLVLVYCLRKTVRDKSRAYIMRRFAPQNGWQFFKHTFRLNLTFGRSLVERAAWGIVGKGTFITDDKMRRTCQELLAQGKGLLLLTAHVGCWQSAVNCMQFLNKPMHVLYYHNPKDNDKTVAEHRGQKAAFDFIDPAGPLGGVVEMMSALRKGEIVCAMADRVFGKEDNSLSVSFLGGKVRVPYSFYRLAAVTGAPVVVAFFPWQGRGRVASRVLAPMYVADKGPRKENYLPYAEQFIDGLTEFCIQYPYQFFNYFDWWNLYATTNDR